MASSLSDQQPADPHRRPQPVAAEQCRAVVRRLRGAFGWALVEEEALVELVLAAAPPEPAAPDLEYLARDQYNRVLWAACRHGADPGRRERAYTEVRQYLYRAAYNRRPDLAEECVQRALELVFTRVETCREPGAFLTFALGKLRQALREEADRAGRSAPHPAGAPQAFGSLAEPATPADAVLAEAEEHERAATLLAALGRLRDARQRQAVVLKFIGGYDDQLIAAYLGITPNLVRVLRCRALAALRDDAELAAMAAESP